MEVYYRKARWLGFIFIAPPIWFSLTLAGYTPQNIKGSEITVAYVVIGICTLVALQCFMGSTRFYFDNGARAGIQIRKHFYGKKVLRFPYSSIQEIAVRCYRRADKGDEGEIAYSVGFTEKTTLFGNDATKFTELRSYDGTDEGRSAARDFAKQICFYTKLDFLDDSETVRLETSSQLHSIS